MIKKKVIAIALLLAILLMIFGCADTDETYSISGVGKYHYIPTSGDTYSIHLSGANNYVYVASGTEVAEIIMSGYNNKVNYSSAYSPDKYISGEGNIAVTHP